MFRPPRRALLATLIATTGCTAQHRAGIPRVRSAERTLGDPLVLGPGEGIVAGVAIAAYNLAVNSAMSLALIRSLNIQLRFVLAEPGGEQVSMPLLPPRADTTEIEEAGATLWITPFAIRLRAGQHRLLGEALEDGRSPPFGWRLYTYGTPLAIEVVAGEVRHIGGIGRLAQTLRFADRVTRDATCAPPEREDNAFYGPMCSLEPIRKGVESPESDVIR